MPTRLLAEIHPVAKTKPPALSSTDPPFERIEFQAPVGFIARLDRVRKKRGLSRAAYIRQAVLMLMQADEKDE